MRRLLLGTAIALIFTTPALADGLQIGMSDRQVRELSDAVIICDRYMKIHADNIEPAYKACGKLEELRRAEAERRVNQVIAEQEAQDRASVAQAAHDFLGEPLPCQ